jgi:hypothetical protein
VDAERLDQEEEDEDGAGNTDDSTGRDILLGNPETWKDMSDEYIEGIGCVYLG